MRLKTLATLVAVAALLPLAGPVLAQEGGAEGVPFPFITLDRAVDDNGNSPKVFARKFSVRPQRVPLHTGAEKATGFAPGPVAGMVAGNSSGTGAAIVAPAGGSFVTPRMTADRAIRRAIREID